MYTLLKVTRGELRYSSAKYIPLQAINVPGINNKQIIFYVVSIIYLCLEILFLYLLRLVIFSRTPFKGVFFHINYVMI